MRESISAARARAAMQVDVRIAHLVARCAVANDEQNHDPRPSVDKPMRVPGPRRKAGALAGVQHLHSSVGLELDLALENVDELILARVRVAGRGLAARSDTGEIDAKIGQFQVIAEPPVPALLDLGAKRLRQKRRAAFRQSQQGRNPICRVPGMFSSLEVKVLYPT